MTQEADGRAEMKLGIAGRRAEEYVAVDGRGRVVAGPFDYYSQAKPHADAAGGYVKFLAEEAAPGSAVTVATTFAEGKTWKVIFYTTAGAAHYAWVDADTQEDAIYAVTGEGSFFNSIIDKTRPIYAVQDEKHRPLNEGADVACDFDSIEAAVQHEKASGGTQGQVGDAVYVFYPGGLARRVYYQSGKYHVARRAEPLTQTRAAEEPRGIVGHVVPHKCPDPPCLIESSEASGPRAASRHMLWHADGNKWKTTGPRTGSHYVVEPRELQTGKRRHLFYVLCDDNGEVDVFRTGQEAMQKADSLEGAFVDGNAQESDRGSLQRLQRQQKDEAQRLRRQQKEELQKLQRQQKEGMQEAPTKPGKKTVKAKEDFAVATRDVKAVRAGRKVGALTNSRAIYDFVYETCVKQSQEIALVIPLDLRGRPLNSKPYVVAMGQKAEVAVNVEDVLRPAIKDNASGFIFCHSHPSGIAKPSKADCKLTATIREKCPSTMPMLDHVVAGDGEWYSFADAGSDKEFRVAGYHKAK